MGDRWNMVRGSEGGALIFDLIDGDTGYWLVTTVTGTRYVIDLDRRLVCRMPSPTATSMRRDFERVPLVRMTRCCIAQPLVMLINLKTPGALITQRTSSLVTFIDRIDLWGAL
jgi:hypothetical protein